MKLNRRTILFSIVMLFPALSVMTQEAKQTSEKAPRKWGPAPAADLTHQRVMLGLAGDPAHTQAVTWRTDKLAETPQVQFTVASANPEFISSASTVQAKLRLQPPQL